MTIRRAKRERKIKTGGRLLKLSSLSPKRHTFTEPHAHTRKQLYRIHITHANCNCTTFTPCTTVLVHSTPCLKCSGTTGDTSHLDTYDLHRKPKAYLRAKGGDPLRSLRLYKCPPTTYSPLSSQGEDFTPRIQGYILPLVGYSWQIEQKCSHTYLFLVCVKATTSET